MLKLLLKNNPIIKKNRQVCNYQTFIYSEYQTDNLCSESYENSTILNIRTIWAQFFFQTDYSNKVNIRITPSEQVHIRKKTYFSYDNIF